MTERERREGTGDTKDNVRDEFDETSKGRKKDATPGSVEEEASGGGGPVEQVQDTVGGLPVVGGVLGGGGGEGGGGPVKQVQDTVGGLTGGGGDDEEESTGGGGGVKDNVQDEHEKTQRH
jgi:hypothetical protein